MYRAALRSSPRAFRGIRQSTLSAAPRRHLTTPPAAKGRTWKGSAARWGLAIAAVYWYSTSPIFADEPICKPQHLTATSLTATPKVARSLAPS